MLWTSWPRGTIKRVLSSLVCTSHPTTLVCPGNWISLWLVHTSSSCSEWGTEMSFWAWGCGVLPGEGRKTLGRRLRRQNRTFLAGSWLQARLRAREQRSLSVPRLRDWTRQRGPGLPWRRQVESRTVHLAEEARWQEVWELQSSVVLCCCSGWPGVVGRNLRWPLGSLPPGVMRLIRLHYMTRVTGFCRCN